MSVGAPPEKPPFGVGDVVQLKSGGLEMTIGGCWKIGPDAWIADCSFSEGLSTGYCHVMTSGFNAAMLQLCPRPMACAPAA